MYESALLGHDLAFGVRLIAGVDEVGRACLAGPIMAAGVLFDLERPIIGARKDLLEELDDSKQLSHADRERLARGVLLHADAVSLVSVPASQIDRIGINPANIFCLERALQAVGERAQRRLVDGKLALGPGALAHELIVRGDGTSATVAAASIVAKVARDRLMARIGERYPGYGFERHAGYGTPEHMGAIARLGPTGAHRLSFDARRSAVFDGAAPARPRTPRRARWRDLAGPELAAHLLATPTLSDRLWTAEPRLAGETRAAFIRRILVR